MIHNNDSSNGFANRPTSTCPASPCKLPGSLEVRSVAAAHPGNALLLTRRYVEQNNAQPRVKEARSSGSPQSGDLSEGNRGVAA